MRVGSRADAGVRGAKRFAEPQRPIAITGSQFNVGWFVFRTPRNPLSGAMIGFVNADVVFQRRIERRADPRWRLACKGPTIKHSPGEEPA
jgi:hypothetical protein